MNFKDHLSYLNELKSHNNREWFQANNEQYQLLRKSFNSFIGDLLKSVSEFDPSIGALEVKDCVFRINRDIRFSKDKSPYKTNFGAYIAEGGKKSNKAGYYFHLSPGESFLAGGIWMPQSDVLSLVRQEIDYNEDEFLQIIQNKDFKKYFKGLEGEKLKTAPKGYSTEHPLIEYLRLKSFIVSYSVSDKELSDFTVEKIIPVLKEIYPLNKFINRSIET